jgi:hypothetical protein
MSATGPAHEDPTAAPREPAPGDDRWLYWAIGGVVVVLLIIGLITYSAGKNNAEAQAKARQLSQKVVAAGLNPPANLDQLTRSLGTDGGAVCSNPANALGKATLNAELTNGAAFVGLRPVIVAKRVVLGELLVLQTYCPEKVPAFQRKINDLKFKNTIRP